MRYTQLVQWTAAGDDIQLEMLGDDGETHRLKVATGCAAALAAALAAEAGKIDAGGADQQLLRPTGMQTARTADGEPVILVTLKGGVELPLVFRAESLGVLVAELQRLLAVVEPGTQVRWR